MWGLETIRRMNAEAGTAARGKRKLPRVFRSMEDIKGAFTGETKGLVSLGDYVPLGWELLDIPAPLFVRKTGGEENDGGSAMSHGRFKTRLEELFAEHPDYGYAVIEQGPFQFYVGVFKKK